MTYPKHFAAIIGAGVAGSEAAFQLAKRGIGAVIFERNALPYGKIEEGLPKWHIKLRNQEEQKIDDKLQHHNIYFIPKIQLGKDFSLSELIEWQFSAILIAFGAWRDRPLSITGIDQYIGKGLYYQNSLVSWFNHKHEKNYSGPRYQLKDNAIVIGGGLASLDVVKIIMLETVHEALIKNKCPVDIFTLERNGIADSLRKLNLRLADLDISGCTLYYRKSTVDMPLAPMPPKANLERQKKVYQIRKRILKNYQEKYLFQVRDCCQPIDKIIKDSRLAGLIFKETEACDSKPSVNHLQPFVVVSPLVISSIGSIPERIAGLPYHDELLEIENFTSGRISGFENIFALGNAVTGRGNIKESQTHSRHISHQVINDYLGLQENQFEEMINNNERVTAEKVKKITQKLASRLPLTKKQIEFITDKIAKLQQRSGYKGNYKSWISRNLPVRLEEMN